jgi:two-component system nitrate/nitrite sensor histidine kinase NarX
MFPSLGKLSHKIVSLLAVLFIVALAAIGMTLYLSWQLEGVAAAINDAGSLRMRAYRLAHLMAGARQPASPAIPLAAEIDGFERVLADLQRGDPARPLALPRGDEVRQQLDVVAATWRQTLRPPAVAFGNATDPQRAELLAAFEHELAPSVARINELVLAMERSYTENSALLRRVQMGLVVLSILGTVILLQVLLGWVFGPLNSLRAGMRRMSDKDLAVRLPVSRADELGDLAEGFNRMAERIQVAYSTLEERVEAETRSLALRNRELGILYEITAFLGEPAPVDAICAGFLARLRSALGADAGAVRLYEQDSGKLYVVTQEGLSADFMAAELALNCADCLCGDLIEGGSPVAFDTRRPPPGMKLFTCVREGFATASAFNIRYDKQPIGVFNLYFRTPHAVSEQESNLLETLGRHLGVAVENQRLRAREKELAVSEERNLLAQELHDSIAQGLAFMNMQVQLLQDSLRRANLDEAMQTAGLLREGVQESYDDVRELLVHFRTRMHQADLDSAIVAALEKFEGQTGIATEFDREGTGVPLEPEDEVQVMHIVQESLSNVRKHARASRVRVTLRRSLRGAEIDVEDDGGGFDPVNEPNVRSDSHVGLKIMRERAHRIGGECQITSEPGRGSRVRLVLPRKSVQV